MGRRLAFLVGIDDYDDGPRPTKLNNLHGCVNDVASMSRLLWRFDFDVQILMTSPSLLPPLRTTGHHHQPSIETGALPTVDNIRAKLYHLHQIASGGDLFFFHFSGHGAPLRTVAKSPQDGRREDPSLLPMDFACDRPALRGWELNAILKKFCDNGVHVVVSLDSCFSGGAWRERGNTRSPKEWKIPPILPIDELIDEIAVDPVEARCGRLSASWDINAEGLIVMAACSSDQTAREVSRRDECYGAFTYELCHLLEGLSKTRLPTYYNIRNHIENQIKPQTPHIFGRDKLVFLATKDTFLPAPISAEHTDGRASLPIGKIHGVKKGAVFINRLTTSSTVVTVDSVDDCSSKGTIEGDWDDGVVELVPFQWCSTTAFQLNTDPDLGESLRTALRQRLQERIAGDVSVKTATPSALGEDDTVKMTFHLRGIHSNETHISGPACLGCTNSLRKLDLENVSMEEKTAKVANALAHLFRFSQVYQLRDEASLEPQSFHVTLSGDGYTGQPLTSGQELRYTFKNDGWEDLYFTVLNLGPGFQIEQIFPPQNMPARIPSNRECSIPIAFTLPDRLGDGHAYRDIIRTVVTTQKTQGFKYMELPEIWHVTSMGCGVRGTQGRNAICSALPFAWWISDVEVFTKRDPDNLVSS